MNKYNKILKKRHTNRILLYLSICGIEDNWIFTVEQTTFKVALSKVIKHEKTCSNYQHVFISFMFDTFGFLALDAANLLQKI
jgi:hypothetical protein